MKLRGYTLAIILGALIIMANCAPEKDETTTRDRPEPPPPAKILVQPDSTSYPGTNEESEVSILVEGVSNVYSVSFDLSYNPDILTYESGTIGTGGFLGPADDTLFKTSLLSDGPGTLVVGITRQKDISSDGESGSGELCVLKFRTIGKGITDLRLINHAVLDPDGGAISVISEDSQITVN
ncbi:MAG: hypothetical protein JSU92_02380 [Deltaproteobacteria bacterium]|nr:MAG: hypothetical protein JSU92_02380 [Deltaproteobacteria bacterium]